jgi:hypothetical protein
VDTKHIKADREKITPAKASDGFPGRAPSTKRVKIDIDTVKLALAKASESAPGRNRWMDREERHLMLERRDDRVAWFVKTRDFTRKLGDVRRASYKAKDQLTPSDARVAAKDMLEELKKELKGSASAVSLPVWTWSQMVNAHLKVLSRKRPVNRKVKLPSRETQIDVRTTFGINNKTKVFDPDKRPSLAVLQNMRIAELNAHILGTVMLGIAKRRPREKFLAYTKTMLNWAYSNSASSGLIISTPWWPPMKVPSLPVEDDADTNEAEVMEAEQLKLTERKRKFTAEHVGQFLARSELFCADKTSNKKISPGIRFGTWWCALTANRRGSTTRLERINVIEDDPMNDLPGWGSAFWDAGAMKGRKPFLVGVPPIGMHVINLAISDWQVLITESHSKDHETKWVFASTRRVQRPDVADDLDTDIPVHPSSLADYIRNMRGIKDVPKDSKGNFIAEKRKPDFLEGIPDFSLHTIRSAATNFFKDYVGLPPAASSAFLAHDYKADSNDPNAMSQVTEKFYLVSQNMELKIKAMQAWSDAVMEAYDKEGGKWPQPYPPPKPKTIRKRQ